MSDFRNARKCIRPFGMYYCRTWVGILKEIWTADFLKLNWFYPCQEILLLFQCKLLLQGSKGTWYGLAEEESNIHEYVTTQQQNSHHWFNFKVQLEISSPARTSRPPVSERQTHLGLHHDHSKGFTCFLSHLCVVLILCELYRLGYKILKKSIRVKWAPR